MPRDSCKAQFGHHYINKWKKNFQTYKKKEGLTDQRNRPTVPVGKEANKTKNNNDITEITSEPTG